MAGISILEATHSRADMGATGLIRINPVAPGPAMDSVAGNLQHQLPEILAGEQLHQ
jgi:hypothetical protein